MRFRLLFTLTVVTSGCTGDVLSPSASPIALGPGISNARGKVLATATGNARMLLLGGTTPQRVSFSAIQRADGAQGQFEIFSEQDGGIRAHGSIVCMGSGPFGDHEGLARLGGVIEQSSDPALVGRFVRWTASDLGEGANDRADRMTDIILNTEARTLLHCQTGIPAVFFDLQEGNIQVQGH